MENTLFQALSDGSLCLTATQRLAARLQVDYGREMRARGNQCWRTPSITTFEGWLRELYDNAWLDRRLIGDNVALYLWESVVEEDAAGTGLALLNVGKTASAAAQARNIAFLYNIRISGFSQEGEECAAFERWNGAYEKRLAALNAIDSALVAEEVGGLFASGRLSVPKSLMLCGFDELVPSRKKLLQALEAKGTTVADCRTGHAEGRAERFKAPGVNEEIEAAALWAGAKALSNPEASVGVVAVNLELYREELERVFARTLNPLSLMPGGADRWTPYDISLGGPLSNEPVVRAASLFLRVCLEEASFKEWREVFLSPFWGRVLDREARTGIFHLLADRLGPRLELNDLLDLLGRQPFCDQPAAGALARLLRTVREKLKAGERLNPSGWALAFSEALEEAGFADTAGMGSRQYQGNKKLWDALSELKSFDRATGRTGAEWALAQLQKELDAPFRPAVSEASITVMGMLEAAGLSFDHLWVLGASDGAVPEEVRPTPFIPYELQKSAGVRQVSPAQSLARSERIIERLLASAGEVIFSYPASIEESDAAPSPLILKFPEVLEPPRMDDYSPVNQVSAAKAALTKVPEEWLSLKSGEKVKTGTRLFQSQAQCPFRAFAELRLGVSAQEEPEEGIDRRIQGNILHHALKVLHALFPTHESIGDADVDEVQAGVESAVEAAIRSIGGEERARLGEKVLEIERTRLAEMLGDWLAKERERPGFRVIEREMAVTLLLEELAFDFKIDRIDLVDGENVVLDYKSGGKAKTVARLRDERLVEPQLPLYALALDTMKDSMGGVRGVAYACLGRGECKVSGLADESLFKGFSQCHDWDALKAEWRRKLSSLVVEFKEGLADRNPLSKKDFCKFCGLDPLCRKAGDGEGEEG